MKPNSVYTILKMKAHQFSYIKSKDYLILLLLVCLVNIASSQCFKPSVQLPSGGGANRKSVLTKDFNGDGSIDVLAINSGGVVQLFKGNGQGTLFPTSSQLIKTGTSLLFINSATADVDNDGDFDVVIPSYTENVFYLLKNDGSGSFSVTSYSTNINPIAAILDDFDKDGNVDVAIANNGSNNFSIRKGNGLGVFGSPKNFSTSVSGALNPSYIVSSDFDRDGDIDLAVSMATGNMLLIFLGDGKGGYSVLTSYAVGAKPVSMVADYLDADGFIDLAVANTNSSTISVLKGKADYPFFEVAVEYPSGTNPTSIVSSDFNNDGILDLACSNSLTSNISVFKGLGSCTFDTQFTFACNSNAQPQSITTADFNGDGAMDVVTANTAPANADKGISVFINSPPLVSLTQPDCISDKGSITVTVQNLGDTYSFDNGITFQPQNSVNNVSSGTYKVVVMGIGSCLSSIYSAVINNQPPTPILAVTYGDKICSGSPVSINVTNGNQVPNTSIQWTVSSTNVLEANGGLEALPTNSSYVIFQTVRTGNSSAGQVTYSITPSSTNYGITCPGLPQDVQVTVNPVPMISNTSDVNADKLCSGSPTNISITNTNGVSGAFVDWQVSVNSLGASAGTNGYFNGNGRYTLAQPLTNSGGVFSTVTYTVTPKYTGNGFTCSGLPQDVQVIVNPVPMISNTSDVNADKLCSGSPTNISITNTNGVSGAFVDWQVSVNSLGASAGTNGYFNGNGMYTLAQPLTNTGNSPVSLTYLITPKFTGNSFTCQGDNLSITITINPLPAVLGGKNKNICSGSESTILEAEIGSKYNWELVYEFGLKGDITPSGQSEKFSLNLTVDEQDNNQTGAVIYKMSRVSNTTNCISDPSYFVIGVTIDLKRAIDFEATNLCSGTGTKFKPLYSSDQMIESFTWNFGDGNTIKQKEPSHSYVTNGVPITYNVTLTAASSDGGCPSKKDKKITIMPVINVTSNDFYFEDFEQGASNWKQISLNNDDTKVSWKNDTPTSIPLPNSTKVWYTDNYFPSESSAVMGPCFNISSLKRPMISLDYFIDTQENYDGAVLQYFDITKGKWLNIGLKDFGINWYNSIGIASNPGNQESNQFQSGWSGNKKWSTGRFRLDSIPINQRDLVAMRLAFAADAADPAGTSYKGFAFDNFFVGDKTRTVLVEQFDNDYDDNSKIAANTIDKFFNDQLKNGGQPDFNPISYHINLPKEDVLYKDNPEDPSARSSFYGIADLPRSALNGTIFSHLNTLAFTIDTMSLRDTKFDLKIKNLKNNSTTTNPPSALSMDLVITAKSAFSARPLLAYVVLLDNKLTLNDKTYRRIVRKQLLGGDGYLLHRDIDGNVLSWKESESEIKTLPNVEINVPIADPLHLSIVAFIQDKISKEVYQSVVISSPEVPVVYGKSITGIESTIFTNDIFIFPNPAQGQFSVNCPQGAKNWSILNQVGVEVGSGVLEQSANEKHTINATGIAAGVYYFKLATEGGKSFVKKLILLGN